MNQRLRLWVPISVAAAVVGMAVSYKLRPSSAVPPDLIFVKKLKSARHIRSQFPAPRQTVDLARKVGFRIAALNAIGMEPREARGLLTGDPASVFGALSHLGGFGEIIWVDSWSDFPVKLPRTVVPGQVVVPRRAAVRGALDALRSAGACLIQAGPNRYLVAKVTEKEEYEAAIDAQGWRHGGPPPWEIGAQNTESKADLAIRRSLPGTWHLDSSRTPDRRSKSTFTIAANGDFVRDGVGSDGAPLNRLVGTIRIEDGFLIETITNTTQPNSPVPYVLRARVIHADNTELVFRFEGALADSTLRKE